MQVLVEDSVEEPTFCVFVNCFNLSYLLAVLVALLIQQGVDFKGILKGCPVNEEIPPLLEGGGKLEVSLIFFSL